MPTAVLYNMQGSKVGEFELSAALFGAEVNKSVLHETVVNYLANQRQGTQSTKTRTEVSGGGAKPFRQKGTGRARQGSTRAPQWIKGGVALGPKPRDYSYSINKKVKKLAMISALSAKAAEDCVLVIEDLKMDEIKTKKIADMLKAMGVDSKALIVTNEMEKNVYLSARNIEGVKASYVGMLNVYDVLNHDKFIVAKDAIAKLEEVYA
ncbi:MAG: 50S ribosomal protein L4 [Clostridia bacterium]|nr:50S ribosomal protein L4 [Clostridia bacterium]